MFTITKVITARHHNGERILDKVLQLRYPTIEAAKEAIRRLVKGINAEITPSGFSAFVFTKTKTIHYYISQYGNY